MTQKYVYPFASSVAEGKGARPDLLGGKGAGLAEMTALGIRVPPGCTISTEAYRNYYNAGNRYPEGMWDELMVAIQEIEQAVGAVFGDRRRPLLLSVRSGARESMPGMMDTVLNIGLNDETVQGLIQTSGDSRFAYDSYRRFVAMFGNVVMGVPHKVFEELLEAAKKRSGVRTDSELSAPVLQGLIGPMKARVQESTGRAFPTRPLDQLRMSIDAVFASWHNDRAVAYRRLHGIPDDWGTAVNVQAMVFGNLGENSGTGVVFTRDPSKGEKSIYGEFLQNAQGEDVVAGIRDPQHISALRRLMPQVYNELVEVCQRLERHFGDMQDIEFTVQEGTLYLLQTRNAKRAAPAAIRVAVEMAHEGLIDKRQAVMRVEPEQIDQLLHPMIDPQAEVKVLARGLPASPGAASGLVVFTAEEAVRRHESGVRVLLVRNETSPEDIRGMHAAQGIVTARGGMTCIAGETRVLTNRGLLTAENAFALFQAGIVLRILSLDSRTLQPVWRRVIAAGCRPSEVITVAVSQTGRAQRNVLRLTADHKMYTLQNRKLVKKRLDAVLADGDFLTVVDHIPSCEETVTSPDMAYIVGAILSDGYVRVTPTKGSVTFTQKPTPEKAGFIHAVEEAFEQAFDVPFTYVRERETVGTLKGRTIRGAVADRIAFRREPAVSLAAIRDNLSGWVLTLDRAALLHFLAGFVDGDGTYAKESSPVRLQISVSHAKRNILEGLAIACLRLGIVPQITPNRENYILQIVEHVDDILAYTHRVQADIPLRQYESKCLAVKALCHDIIEQVNYMGRVREAMKRNLMFGVEKLRRDVLPLCPAEVSRPFAMLLNAPLRSYRAVRIGGIEPTSVYNFEVDATDDMDKNFVVFSSHLTPVLVSNSHAAVVARGMGKSCVVGCRALVINEGSGYCRIGDQVIHAGEFLTIDGSTGAVMLGQVPLVEADLGGDFAQLMEWADGYRKLGVRCNADTPRDAEIARKFGAEGIGLCRTEHMFFAEDRIMAVRQMIVAETDEQRRAALAQILPMQKSDFKAIFRIMAGLPVTVRLLDPPLHEFLPQALEEIGELAAYMRRPAREVRIRVEKMHESNPMLGHRGCRLGITTPDIYNMQVQAIMEAACELKLEGVEVQPEIMVPLVGHLKELEIVKGHIHEVAEQVMRQKGVRVPFLVGTMIELPRAVLIADVIAREAEFFSYGTNDLTQTTLGLSRDDSGMFLPAYVEQGILEYDPFVVLDQESVGELIRIGVERGRQTRPELKVGICGEHGGEPRSIAFFHRTNLDYVSCSPFRVPIARLAAAQAALQQQDDPT